MKVIYTELLEATEIELIGKTIEHINNFITPRAYTGELVISYSTDGVWKRLYHATLDDGAGNSCAASKIATMINHPETYLSGCISKSKLVAHEKKRHGAIRLPNCIDPENSGWTGEIIIAFSGREEWQDVLFCAGIVLTLSKTIKVDFDSPEQIKNDPTWGTIMNLCDFLI